MMTAFNTFDFLAPIYDRFVKPADPARFSSIANLPTNGLLLDVGGGTGMKSSSLLNMTAGIVIADSSMGMLAQARKKGGFTIVCAESEHLPFKAEIFERVIMVDAFHHVADHQQTADEMWRVTKQAGRIVIEEPDIRAMAVKFVAVVEKIALMRSKFMTAHKIMACFNAPEAKSKIESDNPTAWIIVEKPAG